MKISGFSIIRDGERFGYPFVESIRSILPLVDEFVLAVGKSDDRTLDLARSINSSKLRIIETVWDENLRRGGHIMAQQTNLALDHCTGDWCFYLQGDEIIHEQDHGRIAAAMRRYLPLRRIEGLSFRYRHFYGSYQLINPLPYRRQVRIVRRDTAVRSVGDACGFAVNGRKLRTRRTGAKVYHYGWVREPLTMGKKTTLFSSFYSEEKPSGSINPSTADVEASQPYQYQPEACIPFRGTHPAAMHEVIAAQSWPEPSYEYTPRWRNPRWWDGFLRKNFKSIFRLFERPQSQPRAKATDAQNKRAA